MGTFEICLRCCSVFCMWSWCSQNKPMWSKCSHQPYGENIFRMSLGKFQITANCYRQSNVVYMLMLHSKCCINIPIGSRLNIWSGNIWNVLNLLLVGKWWVPSTRAYNVLKMFLLVSRPPCPQCNHLGPCLWQGQPSSCNWVNHWLASWDYLWLGWEGTHSIIGFWTLSVDIWGNFPLHSSLIEHWWKFDRLPKIPSMGLWRLENWTTRQSFTSGGRGTCTQTSILMIGSGWTWSKGLSGLYRLIGVTSMIQSSLACSGWGSWIGLALTSRCTKQHKPFNTPSPCTFVPYPELWSWNPG